MEIFTASNAFNCISFFTVVELSTCRIPPNPMPPSISPSNMLVEGSNMTVNCSAVRLPVPTISLYISGRFVRQYVAWFVVTTVYNLTRDMTYVSCYADNGCGPPMEAREEINVVYKPDVTAAGVTMASYGDSVTLRCLVEANPEPTMMFWRDRMKTIPIIIGPKYSVNIQPSKYDKHRWVMQLSIISITDDELGDYFCHAANEYGNASSPVSVQLRHIVPVENLKHCCAEENVSAACSAACSSYLDIDSVIDKPECLPDFDKIMRCGSDESDHHRCCSLAGVERNCLGWCRGGLVDSPYTKHCLTKYAKKIMNCFRDDRDRLPGPPQNVRVGRIDGQSATIGWDPPLKNPESVELYRVFCKQDYSKGPLMKNDVKKTILKITSLVAGVEYECVVKAGNTLGTSMVSEPVRFMTRTQ
ncbi:DB module [Nesidiocoris tenuis]|uniref:DB module n=1 Tax=Nesidiocoris tenuis TaxID=355587 RepID=A0ABN7AQK2_9HEMI|nr:DB module [Nesidiocoris tenuis]